MTEVYAVAVVSSSVADGGAEAVASASVRGVRRVLHVHCEKRMSLLPAASWPATRCAMDQALEAAIGD
jgi:hypothetical protein